MLVYQNEDYMGSLNKKSSGAQCFIMALGLFWDIVTGLPWTSNGVGSLEPRGYCIFLPGAHYLTINSPHGADSLLNKLPQLLLLKWMSIGEVHIWIVTVPRWPPIRDVADILEILELSGFILLGKLRFLLTEMVNYQAKLTAFVQHVGFERGPPFEIYPKHTTGTLPKYSFNIC